MSTDLLRDLTARLGSPSEARWLAEEVAPGRRAPGGTLDESARRRLETLVARRLAGEPLQYVLGSWAFRTLDLAVDRRALIPRPETEQVVEVARAELAEVARARPDVVVVDLGTGSGAIALSIAVEEAPRRPGLRLWATDRDPGALTLARANRERVGRAHAGVADRVALAHGNWFGALDPDLRGRIDLVVANPPYVDASAWASLEPELHHEPRQALVSATASDGTPGMADIEQLLVAAPGWLARPGALVLELSPEQAGPASEMARTLGYGDVRVAADLAGRPRVLVGRTQ